MKTQVTLVLLMIVVVSGGFAAVAQAETPRQALSPTQQPDQQLVGCGEGCEAVGTSAALLLFDALPDRLPDTDRDSVAPRYWRIDNTPVLSEKVRGSLCGSAKDGNWETIVDTAVNYRGISVEDALALAECRVADATANPRPGNLIHAAIYYNGGVGLIVRNITSYLLRHDPSPEKNQIFVNLVRGVGEQENIFTELNDVWSTMKNPNKRMALWKTAKIVCLAIDLYNIKGLEDIRENECRTEPFDFPPRAPRQ